MKGYFLEVGELLDILCGTLVNSSRVIKVPAAQVYVKFKSNSAITGKGFYLTAMVNKDEGCKQTFDSPTGVITSPNYPNALSAMRDCHWRILAPEGRRVKLTFQELNLPRDESSGICLSYIQ
ncbi:cubilin, partial [Nephila pilipes]